MFPITAQLVNLLRSISGVLYDTVKGLKRCRVRLALVSCGLPARAMVTSMKQHNGKCTCLYCYHSGVTVGDDHLHRYWPYDQDAVLQSHDSVKLDISEAVNLQVPVSKPAYTLD